MLADVYSSMAGVMEFEGEGVRSCHIIQLLSVNLAQRTNRQVIQRNSWFTRSEILFILSSYYETPMLFTFFPNADDPCNTDDEIIVISDSSEKEGK